MSQLSIKKSIFIVGVEKLSMMLLHLITSIILARLLLPSDYGTVAILAVFIGLSNLIVDSGLGGSLIYHKDVDNKDYSTVFWMNIFTAILVYIIIYISANPLSAFYRLPILATLVKVLGITVIFNSLGLIQRTIMTKMLKFKSLAVISITSYIISSFTAILLAIEGYGIWALISQQVLASLITTVILISHNRFIPDFSFSWELIKKHWKVGSGLFFSSLLRIIYDNMYLQLIGKCNNIKDVGYYNQAQKIKDIPSGLFSNIFESTLFPILCKYDDKYEFAEKYVKIQSLLSFLSVPIFLLMVLISSEIIQILIGNKWIDSTPLLRIMSIGSIFYVMELVNRNGLKARGYSFLIFKIDLAKRTLALTIMVIALHLYGVIGIACAFVINSFIGWLINTYYLAIHTTLPLFLSIWSLMKYFGYSVLPIIASIVTVNFLITDNDLINASIYSAIYLGIYILTCAIVKDKSFLQVYWYIHSKLA